MDTTTIIQAVDTLAHVIAEEPVQIEIPARHSIMHFFINGGAGYTFRPYINEKIKRGFR